ncbi:unnamed protein product [Mytilus coruscus]|uniref:HMCN n=1 Tax=Mytilus coruscus TaxID=42192 RepID=A0A6J8DWZ5_MYTCO|nr:unnamed protein product [Mytilus coruscus]
MFNPVIIILTVSTLHESYASWCTMQQQISCMCFQSTRISCRDQRTLTQIPSGIPTDTTYLYLTGNAISSINSTVLSELTSLFILDLKNNYISSIESGAFADLTSLYLLSLESNRITSMNSTVLSGLTSLNTLRLQNNHISSIEHGAFTSLVSLEILNLENNKFSSLKSGMFASLVSLSNLNLKDNNLTTVSANLFGSTTNLRELDLSGMALMCCSMIDLIKWAQNQTELTVFTGTCHDLNTTTDIDSFNSTICSVDGEWGSWSTTPCSVTCGNGFKFRNRSCDNPSPSKDGQYCVGNSTEYSNCRLRNCPVDGQWGSWSTTSCSVSCGDGIWYRNRSCDSPKPSADGKYCVGPSMESMLCNLGECRESCKESDKKSEWKKAKEGKWRRNR